MTSPTSDPGPIDAFEAHRDRLFGLAYRMTGSVAGAEDIVSDTWMRWHATDRSRIANPAAWLTTVATRLAVDQLRSARHRREVYVGPWLPEPLVDTGATPEQAAELADSLTLAFLVLLDTLAPVERAVLVLHDVFGHSFDEVAAAVGRSPAACRQMASRTRRRLADVPRPPAPSPDVEHRLVDRLLTGLAVGDVDTVLEVLAPDVVAVADGGPDRRAARRPVVGADRVARYLLTLARRLADTGAEIALGRANGAPAIIVRRGGRADLVTIVEVVGDRISRVSSVLAPDKLGHLDRS